MPNARTLALLALLVVPAALAAVPAPARAIDFQRDVVYATPGGLELKLDAYLPDGAGPHPAVVVIHGGSWRSGDKLQLAIHALAFARAGVAAFSIDYRLAPRHKWPAQILDCAAAVRWVRANAGKLRVDPERIGAFGYSAGGHLAALLGASPDGAWREADTPADAPSARVAAVVAGGAPCDFTDVGPSSRTFVFLVGKTRAEAPDVYEKMSPVTHATADDPPMLFVHGGADLAVGLDEPRGMIAALERVGVPADIVVLAGAGHIAAAIHPTGIDRATRFLVERLAAKEPRENEPAPGPGPEARKPGGARLF